MSTRKPAVPATHNVPSGMGGSFDVIVVEDRGETCLVRVRMRNRDWDGYELVVQKSEMKPLGARRVRG